MSTTTSRAKLLRINCDAIHDIDILPIEISNNNDDELKNQLLLFSHDRQTCFERREYWIWCDDGERRLVPIYYDSEGLDKQLFPNHRANALITAGRFTTREFNNTVNRTSLVQHRNVNQELKDHWGSNFIVGDVICVIDEGLSLPDVNIYGNDPIGFVCTDRMPSQAMIDEYGELKSCNMIHPNRKYILPPSNSTSQQWKAYIANPPFENVTYPVYPARGIPAKNYFALLKKWGYQPPIKR